MKRLLFTTLLVFSFFVSSVFLATVNPTLAATIMVVSTTSDIVADDGLCSLSEAITAANTDTASGATAGECAAGSGADRIDIPTGAYTLSGGSPLIINSDLTLNEAGGPITIILGDVFIINGAKLRILGDVALDISGDLTVEAGSELSADAGGYPGDNGPGAGQAGGFRIGGGGGGHGGIGGQGGGLGVRSGGAAYGDDLSPTTLGSGGGGSGYANAPGGYGGGHLDLTVGGTLTVDGTISANGADGVTYSTYAASGGGAGGSIQVSAGTLAGSGTVQANGGNGGISSYAWGGGGAGGRISLFNDLSYFVGTITVSGGSGYQTSEDGTIYADSLPDIAVTKQGPDTVAVGEEVTYTIGVSNQGDAPALNVAVTDTLPPEVSFVSANPIPDDVTGQVLTFNLGNIDAGASTTITINVSVDATSGTATNTASATTGSTEGGQGTSNNSAASSATIGSPDITVRLLDSLGNGIEGGVVKHYSSGWKDFGTTDATGQVTNSSITPKSYKFRMTYAGASNEQTQDVETDPLVVFQTTSVTVQLKDSGGNPIDTGQVKYYASGWKTFGSTSGGQASLELLPKSYKFRMTYAGASNEQTQDVETDPLVVFQTGKVVSDSGTCTHYYAGGWKVFTSGMELLPNTYKFRFNDGEPETNYEVNAGSVNNIH